MTNFIKYIVSIMLVTLLVSCENNKVRFNEELLEKIIIENSDLPSRFSYIDLFVKCSENKYAITDIDFLKDSWSNSNSGQSLKDFLNKVLNHQDVFQNCNSLICFELNTKIVERYKEGSFESFMNAYFLKLSTQRLQLNPDIKLSQEELNTILYYCFLNGYLSNYDDYSGFYYITLGKV